MPGKCCKDIQYKGGFELLEGPFKHVVYVDLPPRCLSFEARTRAPGGEVFH